MPTVYNIIDIVMLRGGFEQGLGFGRNSQGIVDPIHVPVKGARYGCWYVHTDDDEKTKKKNYQALATPIPHLCQSFPVWKYTEH